MHHSAFKLFFITPILPLSLKSSSQRMVITCCTVVAALEAGFKRAVRVKFHADIFYNIPHEKFEYQPMDRTIP
jgi:hypothetical protein